MPASAHTKTRAYALVGLLSTALFVGLAVRRLDLASVERAFRSVELLPWLPLAVLSYLAGHLVRGWRCKLLVSREAKLALSTATNVVVLGYAVNNVLPARLGEIARAGMLAQTSGLPFVQSLTVTLFERVLDGLCLLVLLLCTSPAWPEVTWVKTTLEFGAVIFGVASAGLLFAVLAPSALIGLASRTLYRFGAGVHDRVVKLVGQLVAGVSYVRDLRAFLGIASLSLTVWLFEGGMFLALLPAVGLQADPWLALLAMCVTNLGILAPSTPGFIGPFHFFCMRAVLLAGVTESVAFSYAALVHLSFYVPITLWGVGIGFVYGLSLGEMVSRAKAAQPLSERGTLASVRPPAPKIEPEPSRFVIALCDAFLPPGEIERERREILRDVARFVEAELGDLPGRFAGLFALGMLGFRSLTVLRFWSRYEQLALGTRRAWTERFAYGGLAPARQLFRGVRSTALLAYYEHPLVRARMLQETASAGSELIRISASRRHVKA